MKRVIINPPNLPPPRGFNHGILVTGGHVLFLAGQDASDATGRIVSPGDLVGQFEQVLRNLKTVVEAAGGTLQDVVKLTIFVRDRDTYIAQLRPVGQVFRRYFRDYYPAMALFQVSGFFKDEAVVEMEGFAVIEAPQERSTAVEPVPLLERER
ncbi:MAG: RidA family protein [Armatimonadota bacterium]